jgi:hypothetical protein
MHGLQVAGEPIGERGVVPDGCVLAGRRPGAQVGGVLLPGVGEDVDLGEGLGQLFDDRLAVGRLDGNGAHG